MGMILICIGGVAMVAGAIPLMMWSDRVTRTRVEQRLERWEATGREGPRPGDYIGGGGSTTGGF
ncbi:MAG: hypothetical protein ABW001_11225 [Mycobacterium sp.]